MKRIIYLFKRIVNLDYKNMFKICKAISKKTKKNKIVIFFDMPTYYTSQGQLLASQANGIFVFSLELTLSGPYFLSYFAINSFA